MSVSMSAQIRWSIALNASGVDWDKLQHPIALFMKDFYIYEIGSSFSRIGTINLEEKEYQLWASKDKMADIYFAVLPEFPKQTKAEGGKPTQETGES